jgi:uncharacterized protein YndB with AHSA1/START domain
MNDTISMSDTIVTEIDIAAPPERVFQAWIDPKQRPRVVGRRPGLPQHQARKRLRVGGKWRTEGKGMEGKPFTVSGEYTRIDPPRALGFTWNHDWGPSGMPETHVLIELTPTSSGTHVTVTHSGFTNAPERDAHNKGWQRVLGWLQAYLRAR